MNNKLRWIAAALALCLLLALAACQKKTGEQDGKNDPITAEEITTTPVPAEKDASAEHAPTKDGDTSAQKDDSTAPDGKVDETSASPGADESPDEETQEGDVITIPDGLEVGGVE